jgi:hypothetical protein
VNGARWVQQTLLDGNTGAPVRVYAIWFNMYPGDARDRWHSNLLPDGRVVHFWDETESVGRLFAGAVQRLAVRRAPQSIDLEGDVLWDAYLLYGRDARWEADDTPADVISWGAPILLTQETFQRDFLSALGRPPHDIDAGRRAPQDRGAQTPQLTGPTAPHWGTTWGL